MAETNISTHQHISHQSMWSVEISHATWFLLSRDHPPHCGSLPISCDISTLLHSIYYSWFILSICSDNTVVWRMGFSYNKGTEQNGT